MIYDNPKSSFLRLGSRIRLDSLDKLVSSRLVSFTIQNRDSRRRSCSIRISCRRESETIRSLKRFDCFVRLLLCQASHYPDTLSAAHSGTQHAQTLITALFNQTDEDKLRKDFSYDFYDGQGVSHPVTDLFEDIDVCVQQPKVDNDPFAEIVREKLSRIFHRKGAVSGIDGPLLMPDSSIYGARSPVRLLDADGTVVVLPYLLNIPFLRMVARDSALTRLKRWTIAPVYRSAPGGGVRVFFLPHRTETDLSF